jgi:hypothetical protein
MARRRQAKVKEAAMHMPQLPPRWPGRSSHGTKFGTITAFAAAAAAVIGVFAGPAAASTVTAAAPGIPEVPITSAWASGYAAVPMPGGAPSFTHIQDTYTIPTLNCAKTPNAVAEFRTGLDGISDGTIERVGVSATCSGGQPKGDVAWYQMIPANPHPILVFAAKAGDVMHASITVGPPGAYTLSLVDLTSGHSFAVPTSCTTCLNSSAQVTVGPPGPGSMGGPPGGAGTPPADFGTVRFHDIIVTDSVGISGGLANPHWNTDRLIQPSIPHPYTVAGPLSAPYTAFTDTWHT